VQLDRLVQLLEAPVFARLRLQLLEPVRFAPLVRTLYGILMLLPQGGAYQTLAQRLSAVPQIGLLRLSEAGLGGAGVKQPPPPKHAFGGASSQAPVDFKPLLAAFDAAQGRQRALNRTAHEMRRLRFIDSE
jgi:vacuole morphology and inheritance protein 14